MSCPVLESLSRAVDAVSGLPVPSGLGAAAVLEEQARVLAEAVARMQRQLAVRMAAQEREAPPPTDVRGDAVRAGLGTAQAGRLRLLGRFAADHPDLGTAWARGAITEDHVAAVRDGGARLATPQLREELVAAVLRHLPALDAKRARRLVAHAVDQLQPGDPDSEELSDHAARCLAWSRTPRGGIAFQGYLPAAEAAAFTGAVEALVVSLRSEGDGLSPGQRRADALASLVAAAGRAGLPSGGGLPAAMTLTVSLDEATRVALRDPAAFGTLFQARPHGGSTAGGSPCGDATARFGVCCAAVTPVLHDGPAPGSLLDRIARTGTLPLAVGRGVRLATPAQRRALQVRDGGCAIPGCTIGAAHTEPHHVTPWSLGGATDLDDLVSLCWAHHRLTELGKYRFIRRQPSQPKPAGALEHPLWWILPPTA